jgi:hypothetical protein
MIREITRQELKGEKLSTNNHQFIVDLVSQYSVRKQGSRVVSTRFTSPDKKETTSIRQTVGPLKLLLVIYEENGQKILVVGPVMSYKEE